MLSGWACGTASLSCLWPLEDGHKLGASVNTAAAAEELHVSAAAFAELLLKMIFSVFSSSPPCPANPKMMLSDLLFCLKLRLLLEKVKN